MTSTPPSPGIPQLKRRYPIGARLCALIVLGALLAACGHKAQVRVPGRPPTTRQTPAPTTRTTGAPPATATVIPRPAAPQPPPTSPGPSAVPAPEPIAPSVTGPSIRIGLYTSATDIKISSGTEFYLVEKIPESPRHIVPGEIQVRVEREGQGQDLYRIQVAALSRSDTAEELRRTVSAKFGLPAVVRDTPTGLTRQVRVGEFETREEAQDFLSTVREAGYADAIVVRDTSTRGSGDPTLALRGPDRLFRVSAVGFLFIPAPGTDFLRLDGKPYRGVFDVSLNRNGRITVVNQVGVEEYLFGVVPSEISPAQYPGFAALAAQAVAARTYALKNMGRFRAEGFDLTADVRTQVYGGVAAERQPTSEAVQKTAGLSLYYDGNLIDAMYMSTCGGRTEDFSNVFDTAPVPYLRSVTCAMESGAASDADARISGRNRLPGLFPSDDGGIANRDIELAVVLGIAEPAALSAEFLSAPVRAEEARAWTERARNAAAANSGTGPGTRDDDAWGTRAGFVRHAAEAFFGAAEIERRISPADAEYFVGNLKDGSDVPAAARRPLAYLIQAQLWRPYPDNTARAAERLRRADALSWLTRWVESVRPELLRTGVFGSTAPAGEDAVARIVIKGGGRSYDTALAPDVRLFRIAAGRSTPVEALNVIGNERIRYHLGAAGSIDFLEIELNSTGASSDRFSPVASWQTTLARSAVAEKLRGLADSIGELKDLRPARLGNSGRVVQILLVGSRGSMTLNGYRFRNALGLRDTLFTISREVNPAGNVDRFMFNGRGWGHGVGMCQVGAFGMARSGRSFEEILKTYYQGVELRKAY